MGFFGLDAPAPKARGGQTRAASANDAALAHKLECKGCPLNAAKFVQTGHIEPIGSERPIAYFLGAAPSARADRDGVPFSGVDYKFYRRMIPPAMLGKVRWNNVVRSFTGQGPVVPCQNRDRTSELKAIKPGAFLETECCRPSVVADIERTKPKAIFGLGHAPLKWALPTIANPRAYLWQGRRIPVKIGTHTCWYYPFEQYTDIEARRKWDTHVTDDEKHFARCMFKAFEQLAEDSERPHVTTREEAMEGIVCVDGSGADDLNRVLKFIDAALTDKLNGFDYETNALRPYNLSAKILTFAIARKKKAMAVALDHRQNKWDDESREKVRLALRRYLTEGDGPIKAAHQLAFEMEWSAVKFSRKAVRGTKWGDTISQAYIINPKQGLLGLEDLTHQYWGFNLKDLSRVNRKDLDNEPLENVLPYNAMDAKYHRALYIVQREILEETGMLKTYEHQLARVPTLVLTQMKGLALDQEVVTEFRERYQSRMRKAVKKIRALPCCEKFKVKHGAEFNPGSNPDVVKMLTIIGHKSRKTTAEVLGPINHPIIAPLLAWRKAQKLLGTYALNVSEAHTDYEGKPVPRSEHVFDDGKIHPIISSYKVETWRTSSEEPNIQNWPKRGPNVDIRKCVVAPPGHKVVAFDYAGIQARNIAMESRDKAFADTFKAGYDIHAVWTERIIKKYPKWAPKNIATDKAVFKESRGIVKNQFVFPTFFGAKGNSIGVGIAKGGHTEIPAKIITELQEELFDQFPRIHKWQKRVQSNYEEFGYVTGLSGFRRYAPIGFNQIINTPIQSDEALIVTTAMNALSEMDYKRFQANMEIHDDLTFMIPTKHLDEHTEIIVAEMARHRFDWINVPLVVEVSVGDNWCDLKDAGVFRMKADGSGIEATHK
jgi:uracil-DNA glycosylase family 4